MILRIFRGLADVADRTRLLALVRDRVYPAIVHSAGLRTLQAGIRKTGSNRVEFVLVTTWQDFDAVLAAMGPDSLRPTWLAEAGDAIEPLTMDHYELVGEELRGVIPLTGGALNLLEGRLAARGGERFFELAREIQAEQLDSGLVLASHIGRRLVGQDADAVFVTVSADPANPAGLGDQWQSAFEDWRISSYHALAQIEAGDGLGPAVLLAGDDRRYLFATAAAAELLGYPQARILGLRVDDLTSPRFRDDVPALWEAFLRDGALGGSIELIRRDGSSIEVAYEARANTPWQGVHASILAAPGTVINISNALASAGLVARYDLATTAP